MKGPNDGATENFPLCHPQRVNFLSTCLLPHSYKLAAMGLPTVIVKAEKKRVKEKIGVVFLSSVSQKPLWKMTSHVLLARTEWECCKGGRNVRVRLLGAGCSG